MKKTICISAFIILLSVAMIGLMSDAFIGACIGVGAFAAACRFYPRLEKLFPRLRAFMRRLDRVAGEQR